MAPEAVFAKHAAADIDSKLPRRYHLFYQNLPDSADWSFGMCWGHAVSQDLVHWTHKPPALTPSPGKSDADGCFTGSALSVDGKPTIVYTGGQVSASS